jgi:predicted DCC family thiol-disulfide oxidoreductase YuxK
MTDISNPSPPFPLGGGPIVLFDGECNLCNATVQFIIRHDKKGVFRFASLQGAYGTRLLASLGMPEITPDTFLLQADDRVYLQSEGALRTLRQLGFPWSLSYVFMILPARLRDAVYAYVARNRYRWFGKRETCYLPTPELRVRFLD